MTLKEMLGENYKDGMTIEDVLAMNVEAPKPDGAEDIEKLKRALSKANGEAADWKKQLREKQSAEEKAEAERAEHDRAIEEELKTLRRERAVSDYTSKFIGKGYAEDLAKETAEKLADGDIDAVFESLGKFATAHESAVKAKLIHDTPKPDGGAPSKNAVTKDALRKMTMEQRNDFYQNHPDEYKSAMNGN